MSQSGLPKSTQRGKRSKSSTSQHLSGQSSVRSRQAVGTGDGAGDGSGEGTGVGEQSCISSMQSSGQHNGQLSNGGNGRELQSGRWISMSVHFSGRSASFASKQDKGQLSIMKKQLVGASVGTVNSVGTLVGDFVGDFVGVLVVGAFVDFAVGDGVRGDTEGCSVCALGSVGADVKLETCCCKIRS